jgi:hypothetical protein
MRTYQTLLAAITSASLCAFGGAASGQEWQLTSAPTNLTWVAVAMSADGSKLAAASTNGPVYVSTNFGGAWQLSKAPTNDWSAIASSADGAKLVAVSGSYLGVGPIYTSTDGGLNWSSNSTPRRAWSCVACSADATRLVAGAKVYDAHGQGFPGPLFTSTNSGGSWQSNNVPPAYWQSVACSADGLKLVAGTSDGGIYTSTDFGATWLSTRFNFGWISVACSCSADGALMVAATGDHYIYVSTNSGVSWAKSSAMPGWGISVVCSGAGRRIGVGATDGFFVSKDWGATWAQMAAPTSFPDAWSADGRRWVGRSWFSNSFGVYDYAGISIYVGISAQSSQLGISRAQDYLMLSWPVPSNDVSLQRSLDVGSAQWETVTNAPVLNLSNLRNEVVLPAAGECGFYRLLEISGADRLFLF